MKRTKEWNVVGNFALEVIYVAIGKKSGQDAVIDIEHSLS